ncbi:MAG: type II toxin-antitoxin system death-on-curing family toxin [Candidatus Nomurabacteria bacterium]|nr:type II toxin-antitoxin system death-on-curing family toxin [Candidatus Nomurabacteria bacterium]
MKAYKRSVKIIAKNYKVDPDEILLFLWIYYDKKHKFNYLKNEHSVVKNEDLKFIKDIVVPSIKKDKVQVKNNQKEVEQVKIIYKDYKFSSVGEPVNIENYITKPEIMTIYEELTADLTTQDDPIYPVGIRDHDLLDSALFHPQTSFEGKLKYPTVQTSSAALMYAISNNHAFHNGNKRTSIVSMLVFLDKHHYNLTCDEPELFRISIDLASHNLVDEYHRYADAEIFELSSWVKRFSKKISKGERQITLRKFKRILVKFNCIILDNGRIQRIEKVKFLGIQREKSYMSKESIGSTISDGNEVSKKLIKSIREDLLLTSEHGIDSNVFYEDAEFTSSEFIHKYKGLLRRLSKT